MVLGLLMAKFSSYDTSRSDALLL
ncbi:hypothetical protein VULLAG_LOCUS2867 [Vulpes lagopus]